MDGANAADWWRASRADLMAMKACYSERLYGISAYHCQQALEKAVKSVVVYHGLPVDVKGLGHNVLHKMFVKMMPKMTITCEQKLYNQRVVKLIESVGRNVQLTTGINTNDCDLATKDFFWGYSLGINVSSKRLENFLNDTKPIMSSAVNKHMPGVIDSVLKMPGRMEPKRFDELLEEVHKSLSQKFSISNPELRIWCWTLPHLLTFIKITPHEEYGRYPGHTLGKKRDKWYKIKHRFLRKLEFEVEYAIDCLRQNVLRR